MRGSSHSTRKRKLARRLMLVVSRASTNARPTLKKPNVRATYLKVLARILGKNLSLNILR